MKGKAFGRTACEEMVEDRSSNGMLTGMVLQGVDIEAHN